MCLFKSILTSIFISLFLCATGNAEIARVLRPNSYQVGSAFIFVWDGGCAAILPEHVLRDAGGPHGAVFVSEGGTTQIFRISARPASKVDERRERSSQYVMVKLRAEPTPSPDNSVTPKLACEDKVPFDNDLAFDEQINCLNRPETRLAVSLPRGRSRALHALDTKLDQQKNELIVKGRHLAGGDSGSPVWLRTGSEGFGQNLRLVGLINGQRLDTNSDASTSHYEILTIKHFSQLFGIFDPTRPSATRCSNDYTPEKQSLEDPVVPFAEKPDYSPNICDHAAAASFDPTRSSHVAQYWTLAELKAATDLEKSIGFCESWVERAPRNAFHFARLLHASLDEEASDAEFGRVIQLYTTALRGGYVASAYGLFELYRSHGDTACFRPGLSEKEAQRACYTEIAEEVMRVSTEHPDWTSWMLSRLGDTDTGQSFLCDEGAKPTECEQHFVNYLLGLQERDTPYTDIAKADLGVIYRLRGIPLGLCENSRECNLEGMRLLAEGDKEGNAVALREYGYALTYQSPVASQFAALTECHDTKSCQQQAIPPLQAAVDLGDTEANLYLGDFYVHPNRRDLTGCEKDGSFAECGSIARHLFLSALEQEGQLAMGYLFYMYFYEGVDLEVCATVSDCRMEAEKYVVLEEDKRNSYRAQDLADWLATNPSKAACENEEACQLRALDAYREAVQKSDGKRGYSAKSAAEILFDFAENGRDPHDPAGPPNFHNLNYHAALIKNPDAVRKQVMAQVMPDLKEAIDLTGNAIANGNDGSTLEWAMTLTAIYLMDRETHYIAPGPSCQDWEEVCQDNALIFLDYMAAKNSAPDDYDHFVTLMLTAPLVRADFCASDITRCTQAYQSALAAYSPYYPERESWQHGWTLLNSVHCRIGEPCTDRRYVAMVADRALSGDETARFGLFRLILDGRETCDSDRCGGVTIEQATQLLSGFNDAELVDRLVQIPVLEEASLKRAAVLGETDLGKLLAMQQQPYPTQTAAERRAFGDALILALEAKRFYARLETVAELVTEIVLGANLTAAPARVELHRAFIENAAGCTAEVRHCETGLARLTSAGPETVKVFQSAMNIKVDGDVGDETRERFAHLIEASCGRRFGEAARDCRAQIVIDQGINLARILAPETTVSDAN